MLAEALAMKDLLIAVTKDWQANENFLATFHIYIVHLMKGLKDFHSNQANGFNKNQAKNLNWSRLGAMNLGYSKLTTFVWKHSWTN